MPLYRPRAARCAKGRRPHRARLAGGGAVENRNMRLILASASPRRADLLRAAGFAFEIVVADVDEAVRAGESPALYVRRLAAEKSAAARSAEGHPIAHTTRDGGPVASRSSSVAGTR